MLIAANYHYVRPSFEEPYPGIHGVTPRELERQLEALSAYGEFVSADAVRSAVAGTGALPARSILVTFDDGLREQFDHAWPVLRRMGIPALFFINTAPVADRTVSAVHKLHLCRASVPPDDFARLLLAHAGGRSLERELGTVSAEAVVHYRYDPPAVAQLKYTLNFLLPRAEREALIASCFAEIFPGEERGLSQALYMDVAQIRALAEAGHVGTHGHEHLPLGRLPRSEAEETLAESLALLERWTGRRPFALSYPYGSREACTKWVADLAGNLGVEFAFTMERAVNLDLTAPLLLARYSASDLPGGAPAANSADPFLGAEARRWHLATVPALAV